jgi:hypothetical protein
MFFVTEKATIICKHPGGEVEKVPSQNWVTIENKRVLVENDPEGRTINGCSNSGGSNKKCLTTLPVQTGYSDLIRVDGKRLCLDPITGFTDGIPPGFFKYVVTDPGQPFVQEGQ